MNFVDNKYVRTVRTDLWSEHAFVSGIVIFMLIAAVYATLVFWIAAMPATEDSTPGNTLVMYGLIQVVVVGVASVMYFLVQVVRRVRLYALGYNIEYSKDPVAQGDAKLRAVAQSTVILQLASIGIYIIVTAFNIALYALARAVATMFQLLNVASLWGVAAVALLIATAVTVILLRRYHQRLHAPFEVLKYDEYNNK